MSNAYFITPIPKNEPNIQYLKGSKERESLLAAYKAYMNGTEEIPMYIGDQKLTEGKKMDVRPPHDHQKVVGHFYEGDKDHVEQAINAALGAKEDWASLGWQDRVAIFLKAADLIAGPYRDKINAATMVGQSKNCMQAEIDSACELIDFLRFNAHYIEKIYSEQPYSPDGMWNRMDYRPLEGFVVAITPFNFTAIAGNLPSAPALMGNTVVWKPNYTQVLAAKVIMEAFQEAGLPAGVINLIYVDGPDLGDVAFSHPDFGGLHFTGSTKIFKHLWKTIGTNIDKYKYYPRIVGETGGKDFIVAHHTAEPKGVATAITRGAFEFQGQKCSAASRAYIAKNIWEDVKEHLLAELKTVKMGAPDDFGNFVNAVISRDSYDKITGYIKRAKESDMCEIVSGGNFDDSKGYFVEPTVILTEDPAYESMEEEIFGPVITIYIYDPVNFEDLLTLVDNTSPYALTGAIFAKDRYAIEYTTKRLSQAAGNFYINDKPTGSVVSQQPFGGARGSGTNDKAGSVYNMLRWVSPRSIKETFVTPTDYRYPWLES